MKHLALLLVIVGMGMAAAFGSQNADPIRLAQIIEGRAAVLGKQSKKALVAYCKVLPGNARSKEQLADGCAPVPKQVDAGAVDTLGSTWAEQRKVASAAKQLAGQRKKKYCGMLSGDALTADQAKDGCEPVKKTGTADEVAKAQETWLGAREALAPLEVAAQAKRAEYCALVVDGKQTEEQTKDGCVIGKTASDAAKIAAARVEWQKVWEPVPVARKALKTAYATLCNIKVDGQLVASQRSANCQPAKTPAEAGAIADARAKWQEADKEASTNGKAAAESKTKLCEVAAGETLTSAQEKAGCAEVPEKGDAAKVAELRKKWQDLKTLAGHAAGAKKYAAGAVDPGTRMSGWFNVAGIPFLLGLLIMGIGGILARRVAKAEALADGGGEGDAKSPTAPTDFGDLLKQTADAIRKLHEEAAATDKPSQDQLDATKTGIEAIQGEQIERIVSARSALIARYGMGGFAEVFGPFSAGERYMNRAWSALVDMYWHETVSSLSIALEHLEEASAALDKVVAESKAA